MLLYPSRMTFCIMLLALLPAVLTSMEDMNQYLKIDEFYLHCGSPQLFNCGCEENDTLLTSSCCIPTSYLCDGETQCPDGSDESNCFCNEDQFQCSYCNEGGACDGNIYWNLYQCIPLTQVNDCEHNCLSGKDESEHENATCEDHWLSYFYIEPNGWTNSFSATICPPESISCGSSQDEHTLYKGCGYSCYSSEKKCNKYPDCIDASDEEDCKCGADEFRCECYGTTPVTCTGDHVCIPKSKQNDGIVDCPDNSDEIKLYKYRRIFKCGRCTVTVHRLTDISKCNDIGFPSCDNSTCYHVPSLACRSKSCNTTDVICTSNCEDSDCKYGFQCEDGGLALQFHFCNRQIDCLDYSDEITNKKGFKCDGLVGKTCILPQSNLFDDIPHCSKKTDIEKEDNFFYCFDKRLIISTEQVCDEVFDCYDLSDECLCEMNENNSFCKVLFSSCSSFALKIPNTTHISNTWDDEIIHIGTKTCRGRVNYVTAYLCDGIPECRDRSDECSCDNPPPYCYDTCPTILALGNRYCDGIEDHAWIQLNRSDCPKGFDEVDCPNRFHCKAKDKVSINRGKVCDGKYDCDDMSDEKNCINPTRKKDNFSSEYEVINNVALRSCFWIIGFIVVGANLYVIIHARKSIKIQSSVSYQNVLLLNISIADFIMGIYLLIIAIYSAVYSGHYGEVANEWQTSLRCSIIGSLAMISSEASCLLMVLLTGFRLYNIRNPFSSQTSSQMKAWKFGTVLVWIISIVLAIVPILEQTSSYFVHEFWFSNRFTKSSISNKSNVIQFACRLAKLNNITFTNHFNDWKSTKKFLEDRFSEYTVKGEFGYYSETSVCMPRFYTHIGDSAWEYTFAIVTLNFLSFLFIAISYLVIYFSSKNKALCRSKARKNKEAVMRKKISRIIITDFLCWIPICTMAYMSFSGVELPSIVYIVSAAVLLPINSAINPLLYSSLPETLMEFWLNIKRKKRAPDISLEEL